MKNRILAPTASRLRELGLLVALSLVTPLAGATPQGVVEEGLLPETQELLTSGVSSGSYHSVFGLVEIGGERVLQQTSGDPADLDTIYRIYSMTKPITVAAALILIDQEKMRLDDPVALYLPEYAEVEVGVENGSDLERVPIERDMTIRDLMRHTSGLTYGIFGNSLVDQLIQEADVFNPENTLETFARKLSRVPLKHQPGTTWEYGLSTDLLGRVIEVAADMPFDSFLASMLFDPLGMSDTAFFVPAEKLERLAQMYQRDGEGLAPSEDPPSTAVPNFLSGGGGLYSTTQDYLRFAQMLANEGELDGARILSRSSCSEMTRNQLGEISPNVRSTGTRGFGLGVAVTTTDRESGPRPGSFWWGGLAGTGFWVDPEMDLIGLFMIQNMGEVQHFGSFRRAVYEDVLH